MIVEPVQTPSSISKPDGDGPTSVTDAGMIGSAEGRVHAWASSHSKDEAVPAPSSKISG